MKNVLGTSLTVTLFGESHGPAVGAVADGLAPGLPVSLEEIRFQLSRRRPAREGETARREKDDFKILSGVFNGRTTGAPLTIEIPNEDIRSGDYQKNIPRPSHADLAARGKYHGFEDWRGGGHFSGRVTAPLTAIGGILLPALKNKGIRVGTRIFACGGIEDAPAEDPEQAVRTLEGADFPVLSSAKGEIMKREILLAAEEQDSIGGVTETWVTGLPAGIGEPWFDSMEGDLSRALFGLGGIKGIEFGAGFALAGLKGSEANDAIRIRNGRVITETNRSGGINGGVTNGMPVIFRCAVKPTPSVGKVQRSVDLESMTETEIRIRGRHDPAIIRRICPVTECVTAIVLCDLLAQRYGTDWLAKEE